LPSEALQQEPPPGCGVVWMPSSTLVCVSMKACRGCSTAAAAAAVMFKGQGALEACLKTTRGGSNTKAAAVAFKGRGALEQGELHSTVLCWGMHTIVYMNRDLTSCRGGSNSSSCSRNSSRRRRSSTVVVSSSSSSSSSWDTVIILTSLPPLSPPFNLAS